jgi:hypothetical protein
MKTELNEAWTDAPPALSTGEQLAVYSQRIATLVNRAISKAGDDSDAMAIACYVAVSRGLLKPSVDDLEDMILGLSDADFDAVTAYLSRVIDRRTRAAVEVADSPGK